MEKLAKCTMGATGTRVMESIDFDCKRCGKTSALSLSTLHDELELRCPVCMTTFTIFVVGEYE